MVSRQMKYVIKGLLRTRALVIKKRVRDQRRGLELMRVGVILPKDVTLEVWEDEIHAFPVFVNVAPESREAIEKIGNFIRNHLN